MPLTVGYRILESLGHNLNPKKEEELLIRLSGREKTIYIDCLRNPLILGFLLSIYAIFFLNKSFLILILFTNIIIGVTRQEYRTYLKIKYALLQPATLRKYYRPLIRRELNPRFEKIIFYGYVLIIHVLVGLAIVRLLLIFK